MRAALRKPAATVLVVIAGGLLVCVAPPRGASASARPCSNQLPAMVVFERTWRAVRGSFGAAGMPTPRVVFVDRPLREMEVDGTPEGFRRVEIYGIQRRALRGERGCRDRLAAKESLIHEFAHVFQAEPWLGGELRANEIREEIPEGLAEAEAQWLMLKVFGLPLSAYAEPVWGVYDAYARQIRHEYPKSLIRHGQFGVNWGRDPRSIPWHEPNPALEPAASG
jgi:hypothetical protein